MSNDTAGVTPYQPWLTPGAAHAAPLPPSQWANQCDVPVTEIKLPSETPYEVKKSEYHHGLVIVNKGMPPQATTATLRLVVATGDVTSVSLGNNENGVVVLFKGT